MKHSRHRSTLAALALTALTMGLMVPGAEAGHRHSRGGWDGPRGGYRSSGYRSGGYREVRACEDHAAHVFFDGREYCAGKDSRGCWIDPSRRCEDDYGHKLVNNPRWVAAHRDGGYCEPRGGWVTENRRWRGDRDGHWNRW